MIFVLLLWLLLWPISFGLLYYLGRSGINYIDNYGFTSLYFLSLTTLLIVHFRTLFNRMLGAFTPLPFILFVLVLVGNLLVIYFVRGQKRIPHIVQTYPTQHFLRMDYRYLVSKTFAILYQQVLIGLLAFYLVEQGMAFPSILILFAIVFTIAHIPMLKAVEKPFAQIYIITAPLAFIFPYLILRFPYGFVYALCIHWLFYIFLELYFCFCNPVRLKQGIDA